MHLAELSLAHSGIDVFCVGLDGGGENYLPRIFGHRGFVMINRVGGQIMKDTKIVMCWSRNIIFHKRNNMFEQSGS